MDFTFGFSATAWIVLGLIAVALGWKLIDFALSENQRKALKVAGVVSLLIATIALGWWATTPDVVTTLPGAITWDTVAATTYANGTVDGNAILVTFKLNGTSHKFIGAETGKFILTYTTSRTDSNIAEAVGRITTDPTCSVTNITTSFDYDGVAKTSTGAWNIVTTDSNSNAYVLDAGIPVLSTKRSDSATVNYTINVNALLAIDPYDSFSFTTTVCGEVFTITVMRV